MEWFTPNDWSALQLTLKVAAFATFFAFSLGVGFAWLFARYRFIGKNFVFDERMGERISNDVIAHCHQCGAPCDTHTNCLNDGCHLLFIQCPSCAEKFAGCCSEACMEEHKLPEEEQRKLRAGRENGNKIFNKSRGRLNTKLGILDPEPSEKP